MSQHALFSILFFCLGLGACGHPPTVKDVLTAKNGEFWDMYARHYATSNPRLPGVYYTYHIYADGTCFRYVNHRNGSMCLYDGGDVVLSHKWRLAADTLKIDDRRYPVLRVSPDSLFFRVTIAVGLERRLVPDTLILIRTNAARLRRSLCK